MKIQVDWNDYDWNTLSQGWAESDYRIIEDHWEDSDEWAQIEILNPHWQTIIALKHADWIID
jgi:hypothetical protein